MAFQASYWGRGMQKCHVKQVFRFESSFGLVINLMMAMKYLFRFGSFTTKDSSEIQFWEDKWSANAPLYRIVWNIRDWIAQVPDSSMPNVAFWWDLVGPRRANWNALLGRLTLVQLSQGRDKFHCNPHQNEFFLVAPCIVWPFILLLRSRMINNF